MASAKLAGVCMFFYRSAAAMTPCRVPAGFNRNRSSLATCVTCGPAIPARSTIRPPDFRRHSRILPAGKYRVQAVLDHDFYCQHQAHGVGNFYSEAIESRSIRPRRRRCRWCSTKWSRLCPLAESAWIREIVLPQ